MEKKGEIFVGYRRAIGITDIQGIVDYMEDNEPFKKVYLIATHPLADPVSEYLEKNLKPLTEVEFILTKDFDETIDEIKERHKEEEMWITSLDDFGDRALSFDPD